MNKRGTTIYGQMKGHRPLKKEKRSNCYYQFIVLQAIMSGTAPLIDSVSGFHTFVPASLFSSPDFPAKIFGRREIGTLLFVSSSFFYRSRVAEIRTGETGSLLPR